MRLISICMSSRRFLSSAANGSSSSRIDGSTASARASATRCCWPPESCSDSDRRGGRAAPGPASRARFAPLRRGVGAAGRQAVGDVLGDRHVREQRVVLEHDADRRAGSAADGRSRRPPIDDRPWRLRDEAGDDPQQRGLAAAGRAEQGDQLAGLDVERDVLHRHGPAVAVRDPVEDEGLSGSLAGGTLNCRHQGAFRGVEVPLEWLMGLQIVCRFPKK